MCFDLSQTRPQRIAHDVSVPPRFYTPITPPYAVNQTCRTRSIDLDLFCLFKERVSDPGVWFSRLRNRNRNLVPVTVINFLDHRRAVSPFHQRHSTDSVSVSSDVFAQFVMGNVIIIGLS